MFVQLHNYRSWWLWSLPDELQCKTTFLLVTVDGQVVFTLDFGVEGPRFKSHPRILFLGEFSRGRERSRSALASLPKEEKEAEVLWRVFRREREKG